MTNRNILSVYQTCMSRAPHKGLKGIADPSKLRLTLEPIKTIRHSLSNVKNKVPPEKRQGVANLVPCLDCERDYVGDTGWTVKKHIVEHKQAVRGLDDNSGITIHMNRNQHYIDWDGASITSSEPLYWKCRVKEAIRIRTHGRTKNLDCGLMLGDSWLSPLNLLIKHADSSLSIFLYSPFFSLTYLFTHPHILMLHSKITLSVTDTPTPALNPHTPGT